MHSVVEVGSAPSKAKYPHSFSDHTYQIKIPNVRFDQGESLKRVYKTVTMTKVILKILTNNVSKEIYSVLP